ncbi:MAG: WYL domain-containing protein, partial [Muribaculaceae bacterium]|nr:WYL domain-containing protein [Muribaculaceae bacterium]
FSLRICPTYDFIMEILSHGPKVEVLAPQSLRNQIKQIITQLSKIYSK